MFGAKTGSSSRLEISSGGSDSAMDTDAYLESLIRKQKIPRTKEYKPSKNQGSKEKEPSRHKPQSSSAGKRPEPLKGAKRSTAKEAKTRQVKKQDDGPVSGERDCVPQGSIQLEPSDSVVDLSKTPQDNSQIKFHSSDQHANEELRITQMSSQNRPGEHLQSHGENGGDLSVHSVSNHDSTKYQKSWPTPKNTTPLGYHTRKKQVINMPSPEKHSLRDGHHTSDKGGPFGSLILSGDLAAGDSTSFNNKGGGLVDDYENDEVFGGSSRPKTRITVDNQSEKQTWLQQEQEQQPEDNTGVGEGLEQSDTIVRQLQKQDQQYHNDHAQQKASKKQSMRGVEETSALITTVSSAIEHFAKSQLKVQQSLQQQQPSQLSATHHSKNHNPQQSLLSQQNNHNTSQQTQGSATSGYVVKSVQSSQRHYGKHVNDHQRHHHLTQSHAPNLTQSSSRTTGPKSPKTHQKSYMQRQRNDHSASQDVQQVHLSSQGGSMVQPHQDAGKHVAQLLKQNQQLSLQVYQLNNQVLKKQGEVSRTKQRLDEALHGNKTISYELVETRQRNQDLEITIMALERELSFKQTASRSFNQPLFNQMSQQQAGNVNVSHQSFLSMQMPHYQTRSPDDRNGIAAAEHNTSVDPTPVNMSTSHFYPSPVSLSTMQPQPRRHTQRTSTNPPLNGNRSQRYDPPNQLSYYLPEQVTSPITLQEQMKSPAEFTMRSPDPIPMTTPLSQNDNYVGHSDNRQIDTGRESVQHLANATMPARVLRQQFGGTKEKSIEGVFQNRKKSRTRTDYEVQSNNQRPQPNQEARVGSNIRASHREYGKMDGASESYNKAYYKDLSLLNASQIHRRLSTEDVQFGSNPQMEYGAAISNMHKNNTQEEEDLNIMGACPNLMHDTTQELEYFVKGSGPEYQFNSRQQRNRSNRYPGQLNNSQSTHSSQTAGQHGKSNDPNDTTNFIISQVQFGNQLELAQAKHGQNVQRHSHQPSAMERDHQLFQEHHRRVQSRPKAIPISAPIANSHQSNSNRGGATPQPHYSSLYIPRQGGQQTTTTHLAKQSSRQQSKQQSYLSFSSKNSVSNSRDIHRQEHHKFKSTSMKQQRQSGEDRLQQPPQAPPQSRQHQHQVNESHYLGNLGGDTGQDIEDVIDQDIEEYEAADGPHHGF